MNQQQNPNPFQDARNLFLHAVNAVHDSALTVQLFTRVPGTMGVGMMFFQLWIGLVCMLLFCGLVVPPEVSTSLAPFQYVRIAVGASVVHVIASLTRFNHVYSYNCGTPWLRPLMPNASWWTCGAISDALISAAIAVTLWHMDIKNLSLWFGFAGCILAPLGQLHIEARDRLRRREIGDAVAMQRQWEEYSRGYTDEE
jgi:hypothetical protein